MGASTMLLLALIVLIQALGTKGTCSTACPFPSICKSPNCCTGDRLIGRCLKGMSTDIKNAFTAEKRFTALYQFDTATPVNKITAQSPVPTWPLPLENNGIQGKAIKGNGATTLKLETFTPDSCLFRNTSTITFSIWVKYGNKSGDSQTIMTLGADTTTPNGARLQISQPNLTREEIGILINTDQFRYFVVIPCPWNIWSHLVVTLELENGPSTVIYRNGKAVEDGHYYICFGCNNTHSQDLYFGDSISATAPNATIDEVALFCTEFNSTAVADMYQFYKGPTGYYLIFEKTYATDSEAQNVKGTIKSMVSGVTDADITSDCVTRVCTVTVYVSSDTGDAINALVESLGSNAKITPTVVPKAKIFLEGRSPTPNEIEVRWRIDDDLPYSVFQYYNISCAPLSAPSSAVYIGFEKYHLRSNFSGLQPFTEYRVTLKQYFLGGAYREVTINVTTQEIAPEAPLEVAVIPLNTSCLRVQWKNPADPIGGLIRGFKIDYVSAVNPAAGKQTVEMVTEYKLFYWYDICGLQHDSKYRMNVTAKTIAYGRSAAAVEGTTLGFAPEVTPNNVRSHNATAPHDDTSTCNVSWDKVPAVANRYNVTSYRIQYFKAGSDKILHAQLKACNTTKILQKLDFYSKYIVKVAAANENGFGSYSQEVFCYTKGIVPTAPPSNAKAVAATSTSIRVTWGAVPKQFQNNLILGYNITYTNPLTGDTKFILVPGEYSNMTVITGLLKFTIYNLTVTAYTDKGMGNSSAFAHLTCPTLEDAPDVPPTNLQVVSKTNHSCEISWADVPPNLANGIIRGFEITGFDTNNTDVNTNSLGIRMTCDKNITITGLQPFRMYNFTVSAFNSMGVSNKSDALSCITDEGVPLLPPSNLRCNPKTSRSFEVCWNELPIIARQGIVRDYTIQYQYLNVSSSPFQYTSSPTLCFIVPGLNEYSMYDVTVRAVTLYPGNYSYTPIKCMTKEGLPTVAPSNVNGNNITAYSLYVQWDAISVPQPGIVRAYIIYYRIANASEDTTKNATVPVHLDRKFTILDLQLFTLYCVQVAGYTVGAGPRSECTNITTDDKWLPPPDGIPNKLYQMANSTTKNCSIEWSKANNSNPDPDGRVTGYSIFYRFYGTNDTWQEKKVDGENTTHFVLTDLDEYNLYEIRVAGFNIYGVGNKSIVLLCKTKEAAPSMSPPNVTAVNASSTSISISWDEIPKLDRNGIIRWYSIRIYELALGSATAVTINYTVPNAENRARRAIAIDPNTRIITGLKKYTTYAIQVYGVTVADGPISPVIFVTTGEDVTTAAVTNFTVVNSSSTSLFMTWSDVPPKHVHGIIRYFVIFYWKADWPIVDMNNITVPIDDVRIPTPAPISSRRRRRSVPVTVPSSAQFKFNMSGLQIWTNYSIQVAAYTVGVGAKTNETTVSTDEDKPCLPPDDIVFDIPKYTSLQVNWDKVKRHCRNGVIRGYRLIYQELTPGSPPVTVNLTSNQFSYLIENMNMEANYTIRVLAYTSKGDGNVSYDLARPDRMGPKHAPINVTAENFTTPTTIPVAWKPINEPSILEKLLGYKIRWKVLSEGDEDIEEAPWNEKTVRKENLSHVIKGLMNFVHYKIEVSGFTRGGFGPSGITSGSTCRCYRRITTNYRVFAPYNSVEISPDLKKVNMSGMIPLILNNLAMECCQTCKSHGGSFVDFVRNGQNDTAFQSNELETISLIDDSNDLSFPIYGWKWQDTYQELYRYIPLVQSPGFAFILLQPKTENPLRQIVKSIFETWPYLLITCIMALVAGIIMWFLDTSYNEGDFPHSYFFGIANGWWWAFISMTTLGYGDKVPKADRSRAFAVIWVLMGLVIYGILSGSICTAFTTVIYQASTKLYGSQVAAIYNTPEYRFAVRRNAKVNTKANYTTFEEILQALLDNEVTGILMDVNEAGTKAKEFKERGQGRIRIHQIFDYSSTFGVVLAGPSKRLYQCSKEWMSGNRAEMSAHFAKYMNVIEEDKVNEMVEIATGLFDAESQVFKDFLFYTLIALGGFAVLGVIYEIVRHVRNKKMNKLHSLSEAFTFKQKVVKELDSFTNKFITHLKDKVESLQDKHQKELEAFFRNNKDQFKKRGQKGKLLPLEDLLRTSSLKI